jgi:hypothetical protein
VAAALEGRRAERGYVTEIRYRTIRQAERVRGILVPTGAGSSNVAIFGTNFECFV